MSLDKIKLNHPCSFCGKDIFIGNGTIIYREPLHFECFKMKCLKDVRESLKKVVERYENELEDYKTYLEKVWDNINRFIKDGKTQQANRLMDIYIRDGEALIRIKKDIKILKEEMGDKLI